MSFVHIFRQQVITSNSNRAENCFKDENIIINKVYKVLVFDLSGLIFTCVTETQEWAGAGRRCRFTFKRTISWKRLDNVNMCDQIDALYHVYLALTLKCPWPCKITEFLLWFRWPRRSLCSWNRGKVKTQGHRNSLSLTLPWHWHDLDLVMNDH